MPFSPIVSFSPITRAGLAVGLCLAGASALAGAQPAPVAGPASIPIQGTSLPANPESDRTLTAPMWTGSSSEQASNAAAAGFNLPQMGEPGDLSMSPRQEHQIGAEVVREIYQADYMVDDPELSDYLSTLGWRLAAASATPALDSTGRTTDVTPPFRFFWVADDNINAFALPGGFIGVNVGTLLATTNEDELASVIAHEEAHVTQRHMARSAQASNGGAITLLSLLAAALAVGLGGNSASSGNAVIAALAIGQSAAYQSEVNYTRAHEQEADRIGIQTVARAGYSAMAMATFFGRLEQQARLYGTNPPEILLTHPVSTSRIAEAENRAALLPVHPPHVNADYELMKARGQVLAEDRPLDAVAAFESRLRTAPASADRRPMLYGLAFAQSEVGQHANALTTLGPPGDNDPQAIRLLRANELLQIGQTDLALAAYQDAARQNPRSVPVLLAWANGLTVTGHADQAREMLLNRTAVLADADEQPLVLKALADAARAQQNWGEAQFQQARYLESRGAFRDALEQVDAGLRIDTLSGQERARLLAQREELRAVLGPEELRALQADRRRRGG